VQKFLICGLLLQKWEELSLYACPELRAESKSKASEERTWLGSRGRV